MLNESPQQGPELRYEEGWGTLPPPAHEQQLPVGCPPPLGLHRDGLFKGILPAEKSWPTQALSGRRGTRHPAALLARAACCCPAAGKAQAGCSVAVPGPLLASVQKSVFPLCFHAVRLGRQGWWCMGVPAMFNALKKNAPLPVSAFDCASSPVCERRDTWHAQTAAASASCLWFVAQVASHHSRVPPAARWVWEPLAGQHPLAMWASGGWESRGSCTALRWHPSFAGVQGVSGAARLTCSSWLRRCSSPLICTEGLLNPETKAAC